MFLREVLGRLVFPPAQNKSLSFVSVPVEAAGAGVPSPELQENVPVVLAVGVERSCSIHSTQRICQPLLLTLLALAAQEALVPVPLLGLMGQTEGTPLLVTTLLMSWQAAAEAGKVPLQGLPTG